MTIEVVLEEFIVVGPEDRPDGSPFVKLRFRATSADDETDASNVVIASACVPYDPNKSIAEYRVIARKKAAVLLAQVQAEFERAAT